MADNGQQQQATPNAQDIMVSVMEVKGEKIIVVADYNTRAITPISVTELVATLHEVANSIEPADFPEGIRAVLVAAALLSSAAVKPE
jgi:hypothetical protein